MNGVNFRQFFPSSGAVGAFDKYKDEVAVSVNKSGIALLGKAEQILGRSGWVAVFGGDKTVWAMQPSTREEGGYTVSRWGGENRKENRCHITATAFIKAENLTTGAVYVGKVENGMVIFPKMPTEIIRKVKK